MLADHRVIQHTRIAAEIALCGAFEDLALAPAIAVTDDPWASGARRPILSRSSGAIAPFRIEQAIDRGP